ncbi:MULTISPECIES: hypothetical protein [unclassified Achromobacter]|uniref:hypothetical protein n=1 Tax=unclassified Achromobacter TaxID=2626865 RepID=UPI000B51B12F|nr:MULTISPECIES: hypothetical protein [unclassified Achromobacter]OWT69234.1 hypothetical protein CEY05_28850 [Achromobacter sp. HZ34]OWT70639.1 hypothetical protein CEY04_27680 [Achromobacter sp. HZ28]
MSHETDDSKLIDALGGTVKVAQLCNLTTGAISQWRTNGIPKGWRSFLRLAKPKVFKAWEISKRPTSAEASHA